MKRMLGTLMAIACALGASAAAAQSVQRDGAAAGFGLVGSLIVVGAAVATIAVTVDSGSTVAH